MTVQLAADAQTYDCRKAFADELIALARDGRAHRRRLQRLGRLEQPRRLPRGVPRPPDQRRHRRAGPRRRRRRPGQRRAIPFVCAAAPFLTGRALEQIKADVAYSNTHVVLCGQSPGMAYGELGPTHHSIEDLSWTRAIAEPDVVVPADPAQTRAAVRWAVANPGPPYLRVAALQGPGRHPGRRAVRVRAGASRPRDGDDVTVIAIGTMVSRALEAAEQLRADGRRGARAQHALRRPARRATRCSRRRARRAASSPPRRPPSAAGSAPRSRPSSPSTSPVPMRILGVRGEFAPTGSTDFLLDHFGLTADGIADAAASLLAMSSPEPLSSPIDQGTQLDQGPARRHRRRDRRARRARRSAVAHPRPGWVEQDAERDLGQRPRRGRRVRWTATPAGGRRRRPQHPARVAACSGTAPTGAPLGPLLSWQDQRTRRGLRTRCAATGDRGPVRSQRSPAGPDVLARPRRAGCSTPTTATDAQSAGRLCLGTVDSLAAQPARRRATDRGRQRRPHPAARRPTPRDWDDDAARPVRRPARGPARIVRLDRAVPGRRAASRRCSTARRSAPCWATRTPRCSPTPAGARARSKPPTAPAPRSWASATRDRPRSRRLCLTVAWDDGDGPRTPSRATSAPAARTLTWLAELLGTTPAALADAGRGRRSDGVHLVPASAAWARPGGTTTRSG